MIKTEDELDKTFTLWLSNFRLFMKECLGSKDINKEHEEVCRVLQFGVSQPGVSQSGGSKNKLFLMPRYTFKSSIITIGYSLWRLLKNPDLRILIYSDSATKAEAFLEGIKNHIEGKVKNSVFRDYFGKFETDPHKGTWNNSAIVINQRKNHSVEPSIDTAGIETGKVGMHYDLIIFDDIVTDLNTTTKSQMDKVYDCYKKALSLLTPTGEVIIVGTRWNFGDAYGRIINENKTNKNFDIIIKKVEVNGVYLFANIGLDKEFLDRQRIEQGTYIVSCLYYNEPVDDETAIFKYADFAFYENINHKELYITCTCDPAGEGEDFTAITVCGTDNMGDIYILDIINEHLDPNQIVDRIIRLNYKWGFNRFGVETNFFRGMLEKEIEMAVEKERSNPKFRLFSKEIFKATAKRGEGKYSRILGLQPYHERGSLKFKGRSVESLSKEFYELAYQMIQFPKAQHDDILDSLAYHLQINRKGGVVKTNDPPERSAAWFELQQYKEFQKINKHMPSRFKKRFNFAFN